MAEIINQRFAQWEALEENQKPKKKMFLKPKDIRPLLTDWDGPQGCFVSDRVMVDGCKIEECYRLEPDHGDEGWDSGWNFLAGDEDEEYCDDSRNFGIYDLNTLCNYDPDIIPLLGMPYGTWLERGEDGQFYEVEKEDEDEEELEQTLEDMKHIPYTQKNVETVSGSEPFEGVDFTNFWDDCDYAKKEYIEPAPSDELIAEIEVELGYKLPASYIWLMKQHNGGMPVNTCYPTNTPTSWAEDHIAITGIMGIGRNKSYSICGELGSQFMIDKWEYPAIGVAICDCPSAGHDMIFLDYRECGPQGEPKVVHIDQENDYAITPLADDFEEFIRGLVGEEEFEEEDGFEDGDEQAMAAASALDEADELAEKSKAFLKGVLADEDSEYYGIVSYFLEFHRDELEEDVVKKLFFTEDPSALTLTEMVDHLQLNRFGSFLDEKTKQQTFIMDLTFDPEITDELLVIYFNLDRQIVNISHES